MSRQVLDERICVVGTSGAGKTYVAQVLAACCGLRYVCNDALIWRSKWQPVPRDERVVAFDAATRESGWVCDGNLGASPEDQLLLHRCDTIVWLDLPRHQIHWQVLARTLKRIWTREPLWHDNVESWRMLFSRESIIWWSIKTYSKRRREYLRLFGSPDYARKHRVHLRTRGEVNHWLSSFKGVGGLP